MARRDVEEAVEKLLEPGLERGPGTCGCGICAGEKLDPPYLH